MKFIAMHLKIYLGVEGAVKKKKRFNSDIYNDDSLQYNNKYTKVPFYL